MASQEDTLALWVFKVACILKTIQTNEGLIVRNAEEMEKQLVELANRMPGDLSIESSLYVMEMLEKLKGSPE